MINRLNIDIKKRGLQFFLDNCYYPQKDLMNDLPLRLYAICRIENMYGILLNAYALSGT